MNAVWFRLRRRLAPESKPSFIIKPRRQFVDEGSVAKFKCSCDGEPAPTVTWERHAGEPISESNKYQV